MKTTTATILAILLGGTAFSAAQEGERQRPPGERRGPTPEQLKEFDKDGDGTLSPEERTAMREALRVRLQEGRKQMLAKYDKDGDGQLSQEEREQMRKDMLERFDANKDGRLDEAERAAMQKEFPGWGGFGGGREGRPGGREGRGPRPDGPGPAPAPEAPAAPEASE